MSFKSRINAKYIVLYQDNRSDKWHYIDIAFQNKEEAQQYVNLILCFDDLLTHNKTFKKTRNIKRLLNFKITERQTKHIASELLAVYDNGVVIWEQSNNIERGALNEL